MNCRLRILSTVEVKKQNISTFSLEQLGKLLDDKLDTKLQNTRHSLASEIKQEFNEVLMKLESEFLKITESPTGEICDLKREISTLREKVQTIEQENIYVRKQVESEQNKPSNISHMETIIKELKQEINDKDQKALLNDIEIIGIPEVSGETPLHIMSTVANKLGVTLNDHDIVFAERVGRHSSNLLQEVQTGNQNRIEARPLVVRLARRITRDILLKNARVRRTLTTVDLDYKG
ncbi:unnamed protein product [Parnassius apollo]|uniref:(apollo) hypothetical protein n=1 Tax=Parnassius apollo TaxID=110799 RepID=A0A8S3XCK2_PARAO|nr:unnamed protein product [Parnassius apollo]